MNYEQMRKHLSEAAMIFAMERMYDRYTNFADFLFGETDKRWLLGAYVVEAIDHNGLDAGLQDLAFLMGQSFDTLELHEHHLRAARELLLSTYAQKDHVKELTELFAIYEKVKIVKVTTQEKVDKLGVIKTPHLLRPAPSDANWDEKRRLQEEALAQVRTIVADNQYAADWPEFLHFDSGNFSLASYMK